MATREERQLMAQLAGTNVAFWRLSGELWRLFNKALDEGYSPDRLLAEARNTRWYKNHAESVRRAQALQKQDPAEYKRRIAKMRSAVQTVETQFGVPIKEDSTYARLAFVNDWDAAELRRRMFGGANRDRERGIERIVQRQLDRGMLGGELGQAAAQLRQYAMSQGLRWNNKRLAKWLQGIAAGTNTVERTQGVMQREAISMFPALKQDILEGSTVRDIASGYIQSYADLLEVDADRVDVYDPDIRAALNAKNADGKYSPLTIGDFENKIRHTAKWLRTRNAQDAMMEGAHAVLQQWGVTW